MKMTKRWDYHDVSKELLNTPLRDIRKEYNIQLIPLEDIPIGRYVAE